MRKPLTIRPSDDRAAPHPCGSPAPTLPAEMTNGSFMSPSEPRNPQNAVVRSTLHFSLTKRPPNTPLRPSPQQTRPQTHRQPHPNHHLRRHPIHLPLHLPPLRRRNLRPQRRAPLRKPQRLPLLPNHRHRRHDQLLPLLQKKRLLPRAPTPRTTTFAILRWRELRFHRRKTTNESTHRGPRPHPVLKMDSGHRHVPGDLAKRWGRASGKYRGVSTRVKLKVESSPRVSSRQKPDGEAADRDGASRLRRGIRPGTSLYLWKMV